MPAQRQSEYMATLSDFEKMLATLSPGEKAQVLKWVVQELEGAFPGIDSRPDICGGEPCIVRTRIPVWLLEKARRSGVSEHALLAAYPSLRAEDLVNAWAYARSNTAEIDAQIRENESSQVTRFYSNENIALPVVLELRRLGHDVLTSLEQGNANAALPDAYVLSFATSTERIVLTNNRRHFIEMHRRRTKDHSGIVVCTFDPDFNGQAHRIHAAVKKTPEMKNQFLRVNRGS